MAQIYTDSQKAALRLNVCRNCPLARCNTGMRTTGASCNINDTICSLDNVLIVNKTKDLNSTCQRGYWKFTDGVAKKGCGCGG